MNSDLQRINWKVTQLERNNRVLRSKIVKLERENKKLETILAKPVKLEV